MDESSSSWWLRPAEQVSAVDEEVANAWPRRYEYGQRLSLRRLTPWTAPMH